MTKLTLKKVDAKELQFLIDCEMQAYKLTVQGHNPVNGDFARLGAIVPFFLDSKGLQNNPLMAFSELLGKGYTPVHTMQSKIVQDEYKSYSMQVYLSKPEAEQSEDYKSVAAEVEVKYHADIIAHNERVYIQEAAALKSEEAAIAAQLKVEEAAKAAQEFDKRVQARMRGSKSKA